MESMIKYMEKEQFKLMYDHINLKITEVHIYVDASFTSNRDQSSQQGYVTIIVETYNKYSVL